MITQNYLKSVLSYDADTGEFVWIKSPRPGWVGKRAGYLKRHGPNAGYIAINVLKKEQKAHRLAWLYIYGDMPDDLIDHINGIRSDNRISNLRKADRAQNNWNSVTPIVNTSGVKGVHYSKPHSRWKAEINCNRKRYYLGLFENKEDAVNAVRSKRLELHGEFANHG